MEIVYELCSRTLVSLFCILVDCGVLVGHSCTRLLSRDGRIKHDLGIYSWLAGRDRDLELQPCVRAHWILARASALRENRNPRAMCFVHASGIQSPRFGIRQS